MVGARSSMILLIAVMLAGCSGAGAYGMQDSDHKSVGNVKDSFAYSLSANNKTKVETYKWENSATKAMIGLSGAIRGGAMELTIKDAAGIVVFEERYTGTDSESVGTQRGLAGVWTIQLSFTDYYGALSMGINANHGA